MELALSLGDTPKNPFCKSKKILGTDLGFCMAVGKVCDNGDRNISKETGRLSEDDERRSCSLDRPPVQLDLLPFSPVHRTQPSSSSNKFPPFPWLNHNLVSEPGVNRRVDEAEEGAVAISSPNSIVSSFQMDFSIFRRAIRGKRDFEGLIIPNNNIEGETDRSRASSRGSEEELENGNISRKKLRLTKEQSVFLEDSFKEHNTLNPKQKLILAKQLNLRPRQVEVWFQNRRARTKLKKTEVDCEYLKRCCEKLTQENRKLQKELQELRALKASKPFYMQLPATTLTMCPSCERVVTATAAPAATTATAEPTKLLSLSTAN